MRGDRTEPDRADDESRDEEPAKVELRRKAVDEGMLTLRRSGLIKVAAGMTTLEEVARETIH